MSLLSEIRDHPTVRQYLRFNRERLPRWVVPTIVFLAVLSWVPLVLMARARVTKSTAPRIQIFPDMDQQPKFRAQAANPLFRDGQAMRLSVEGTVAEGELADDDYLYRGKSGDRWATTIPIKVTEKIMQRGRQRYDIYCAPCHGLGGAGDGMVSVRAEELREGKWIPPVSFHTDVVRGRTDGELFQTITGGIRNMPAYGPQVPMDDRWAIVAYLRALQKSRNATLEDVPADRRSQLR